MHASCLAAANVLGETTSHPSLSSGYITSISLLFFTVAF